MELKLYDGREEKEILAKALEDLEVTEDEVVYYMLMRFYRRWEDYGKDISSR